MLLLHCNKSRKTCRVVRPSFCVLHSQRREVLMPLLRCWITLKIQRAWRTHARERAHVQYIVSDAYMASFFPTKDYNYRYENHAENLAVVLKWIKSKKVGLVKPFLQACVLAYHEQVWAQRTNYEWIGFVETCAAAKQVRVFVMGANFERAQECLHHYVELKEKWKFARNWMARYMSMSASLGCLARTNGVVTDEAMANLVESCRLTGHESEQWVKDEWCGQIVRGYAKSERRNNLKEKEYYVKYGNIDSEEQAWYALQQNARFHYEPMLCDPSKYQEEVIRAAFAKAEGERARVLHLFLFLRLKVIIVDANLGNVNALDYRRFCREYTEDMPLDVFKQWLLRAMDIMLTTNEEEDVFKKEMLRKMEEKVAIERVFELEDLVPRILNARAHAKIAHMVARPRVDKANMAAWWKTMLRKHRFVDLMSNARIKHDQPREYEKPAQLFTSMIIMDSLTEKPPAWDACHIQRFRDEYKEILRKKPTLAKERLHISIQVCMLIKEEWVEDDKEMEAIDPHIGPFINRVNKWAMVHFDVFGHIYAKNK